MRYVACRVQSGDTSIDQYQAIEQQRYPSVSSLDNRAATYTKLGDLQAALRDGKKMIHAARTDITVWQSV